MIFADFRNTSHGDRVSPCTTRAYFVSSTCCDTPPPVAVPCCAQIMTQLCRILCRFFDQLSDRLREVRFGRHQVVFHGDSRGVPPKPSRHEPDTLRPIRSPDSPACCGTTGARPRHRPFSESEGTASADCNFANLPAYRRLFGTHPSQPRRQHPPGPPPTPRPEFPATPETTAHPGGLFPRALVFGE